MSTIWRNEYKYYISDSDAVLLKHNLSKLLKLDSHSNSEGGYMVRSLYFDDPLKSGVSNKLDGIKNRVRYRIRTYGNGEKIRLEAKLRTNQMVRKVSQWISHNEYLTAVSGGRELDNYESDNVFHVFLLNMKKYGLRPSVIVEYDRVAFVIPDTDVRITLDLNVRSYKSDVDLLSPSVQPVPVLLYPRQQILEVKFTEGIPSYVRSVLHSVNTQRYAISKYALCARYIRNNSWEDN